MYAVDQEVTVRFVGELDDDDITIFEELPMEEWYIGGFLTEKMPESVRAIIEQQEFPKGRVTDSPWFWRVVTLSLAVATAWAMVRNW